MENINLIIASNLKKIREERRLSLEAVSKATGVSKSMLGQIERGEVSPTISTVWRIAKGLKISFTGLMDRPNEEPELVCLGQAQPLTTDDGRFRNYVVFPFDDGRRFETYYIEIDPGGRLEAEAHGSGAQEFITVFSGELCLRVQGMELIAKSSDSLHFRADYVHSYENTGAELCRLSMVIFYPPAMT